MTHEQKLAALTPLVAAMQAANTELLALINAIKASLNQLISDAIEQRRTADPRRYATNAGNLANAIRMRVPQVRAAAAKIRAAMQKTQNLYNEIARQERARKVPRKR